MKQLFDEKLTKFICIGAVNTLAGMTIMFGLYNLAGCGYWTSSAANYILTSVLSYCLNKRFTFENKDSIGATAPRFAANIAVCYLLAYGVAKPLVRTLLTDASAELRDNCSMLAGMVLFTGLNYIGQRFFAFSTGEKAGFSIWIKRFFYFCVIAGTCLLVCMNGCGAALLLLFAALFIPHRFRIKHFLPFLFIFGTAIHVITVFIIQPEPVSDYAMLYNAALQAADGDFSFQHTTYFFRWAYQTGFVLWEALLILIFHSMMSIKIANVMLLSGINCLIYLLARRFTDERASQTASLLYMTAVFPGMMCSVLTNQHVSAFFFVCALYVLTGGRRTFSVPRALAAGVLLAFGNIMRPEGIIVIAGLCGTAAFVLIMRRSLRGIVRMAGGIAVTVAAFAICMSAASWAVSTSGVNEYGLSNNWPEWKFILGFNYNTEGSYSDEDSYKYGAAHEIDTPQDVSSAAAAEERQVIRERMSVDPADLFRLMLRKVRRLWTDDPLEHSLGYLNNTDTKLFGIKGTVVYQYFQRLDRASFAYAALLAAAGAAGLMRRKEKGQTFQAVMAPMTLMASFAAFLLVEVQPRYVFLPEIFLYITAAAGVQPVISFLKRIFCKSSEHGAD